VARNRKRRSDRRPRRPADAGARPGLATARAARDETPEPIEHATPDVELAEAQLALGRPELTDDDDALVDDGEVLADDGGEGGDGEDSGSSFGGDDDFDGGTSPVPASSATPARRPGLRLVHFLQGSWRELQRVQWPDRRQVMQATGVVIGFVIVAGAFLGVSDLVATKLVNLILK
jgi:preprotein translocase SecE subunit